MPLLTPKKIDIIKKNAKTEAFDCNNAASALFHVMANIGGDIGLITRNSINSTDDIEQVSPEESFLWLSFLPEETAERLKEIAKNHLVTSSFITNSSRKYDTGEWHIVCCSYQKMRIKTILSHLDPKEIKKPERKIDDLTTFHFK